MKRQNPFYLVRTIALFVIYFLTAKFGLNLHAVQGFATLVWLPTGISLLAIILFGYKLWPGITCGAFLANLLTGAPIPVALGIGAGNTLEALVGAYLLKNVLVFDKSLSRMRDVLGFVLIAVPISTLISATIGVFSLSFGGVIPFSSYTSTWLPWWMGDTISDLLIVPFVLFWGTRPNLASLRTGRVMEFSLILTTVVASGTLVFHGVFQSAFHNTPTVYLIFLPIIWTALRFNQRETATVVLLDSVIAVWSTLQGLGPFAKADASDDLLLLQGFMAVTQVTSLILSTSIAERSKTEVAKSALAEIVRTSDDAIISKTQTGLITSWNRGAEKLLGYPKAEAIGKPMTLIIPKNLRKEEKEVLNKVNKDIRIEHYETERIRKDGRRIFVSVSISPVKDSQGKIIGASSITRDVTEKKTIEKNTLFLSKASKILFSSLDYKTTLSTVAKLAVPSISDWCGVYMKTNTDIEPVVIAHADRQKIKLAKELFRKYPPDMTGKTGLAGVFKTGKIDYQPVLSKEIIERSAQNEDHLAIMRQINFVSAVICPLTIHKQVVGALVFVSSTPHKHFTKQDVSVADELAKRAAIAIENAMLYNEAQKAISLRDDFISLASHEIKTPITSLKMYVQAVGRQFGKKGETSFHSYLERMDQQTDKLTRLVNDLLNISKIQHGKLEFNMEQSDLNLVVKETVDAIQEMTQKHRIFIEGKIMKSVYIDKYRIYQVLTNLLTNAVKYSPEANKIIIRLTPGKDSAIVTVQDFGIGIDADHHKKIFEQFYRVTNSEEKTFPGLGMGLYISREIIRRHDGSMSVVSSKGKGSEFSFKLPYADQENVRTAPSHNQSAPRSIKYLDT